MDDFSLINSSGVSIAYPSLRGNRAFAFNPVDYSVRALDQGKTARLELYTLNGKRILKQILVPGSAAEPFRLPVHELEAGPYLLKMVAGGNSSVQKFTLAR